MIIMFIPIPNGVRVAGEAARKGEAAAKECINYGKAKVSTGGNIMGSAYNTIADYAAQNPFTYAIGTGVASAAVSGVGMAMESNGYNKSGAALEYGGIGMGILTMAPTLFSKRF